MLVYMIPAAAVSVAMLAILLGTGLLALDVITAVIGAVSILLHAFASLSFGFMFAPAFSKPQSAAAALQVLI